MITKKKQVFLVENRRTAVAPLQLKRGVFFSQVETPNGVTIQGQRNRSGRSRTRVNTLPVRDRTRRREVMENMRRGRASASAGGVPRGASRFRGGT